MRETLNSFLFCVVTESIVPLSDSMLKSLAIEASEDGLFEIPSGVDFDAEIAKAREESRQWIEAYNGRNNSI